MLILLALFITFDATSRAIPMKDSAAPHVSGFPIPINISVPPVVLIPGIGGSIMADDTGLRVWIRFYEASYYFQRYMWGRYDVESQTLVPYPGQAKVSPILSGYGLDAIRNLDPSVHWPIYDYLSYFDAIIRELQFQGWVPGYNLFGMPWDWRQSMCWPPTLESLKQTLLDAQRIAGRKVTLVTHSMGALVVKCFIATYPETFDSTVEAWIAIAAPFQGAGAKIFIEFLQGYNLGNIVIGSEDAKGLALESPAVYELLPRQEYEWQQQPHISLTINGARQTFGTTREASSQGTYEVPLRNALARHNITLPGIAMALPEPFNEECWALSQATRTKAAAAAVPGSVRFYNVYGVAQPTPVGLDFGAVGEWGELQAAKYAATQADGDGTVAAESARGHGAAETARREVAADHMGIMAHADTLAFLLDALYDRLSPPPPASPPPP